MLPFTYSPWDIEVGFFPCGTACLSSHQCPTCASMQPAWGEVCRGLLRATGKTASCSILQPNSPGPQLRSRHLGCSPCPLPQQRHRPQAWALKLSSCSTAKNISFLVVIHLTYQATSQSGSGEDNPEVSCLTYIPTSSLVLQAVHRKMIFADKRWTQRK